MQSTVYFTKEISPQRTIDLYRALGHPLPGNIAVKLHSGEVGNQNFIRPAFYKPIIDLVGGHHCGVQHRL